MTIKEDVAPANTTTGVNLTQDPVKRLSKRVLNRSKKQIKQFKSFREFLEERNASDNSTTI